MMPAGEGALSPRGLGRAQPRARTPSPAKPNCQRSRGAPSGLFAVSPGPGGRGRRGAAGQAAACTGAGSVVKGVSQPVPTGTPPRDLADRGTVACRPSAASRDPVPLHPINAFAPANHAYERRETAQETDIHRCVLDLRRTEKTAPPPRPSSTDVAAGTPPSRRQAWRHPATGHHLYLTGRSCPERETWGAAQREQGIFRAGLLREGGPREGRLALRRQRGDSSGPAALPIVASAAT